MKIAMIACGKLGLLVALTIESRGHEVKGYDINPKIQDYLNERKIPFKEEHAEELLRKTKMEMVPLKELVEWADIIFMAPQTPHEPRFEGVTRLPKDRADFDYSYLREAVKNVNEHLTKPKVVVVISTCLPGTIEREVKPLIGPNFRLVYEPLFIAMGTVYKDYLNPEFVLAGSEDNDALYDLEEFYFTIHNKPIFTTDIKTAELIKVAYNTYIGFKITYANTMMEICHKIGANVDDLSKAISMATDRLMSGKYLLGGMGDSGQCHPRDGIAMSWLAKELNLSHNLFDDLMQCREDQTDWLADLIEEQVFNGSCAKPQRMPVVILGVAYKAETNLTGGSCSTLLQNLLKERGIKFTVYDPYVYPNVFVTGIIQGNEIQANLLSTVKITGNEVTSKQIQTDTITAEKIQANTIAVNKLMPDVALYFVATNHPVFKHYRFPKDSIVLDPWGYMPDQDGVKVVRVGRQG